MFALCLFLSIAFACSNVGSSADCSGNGLCIFDQRTNATRCVCDSGFLGDNCASTCTMAGFAVECSQNGICAFDQRVNGTRCVCDMGFYGRNCNSTTTARPTTVTPTTVPPTSPTTAPPTTFPPTTAPLLTTVAESTLTTAPVTTTMGAMTFSNCIDYSTYFKGEKSVCNGQGTCEMYPVGSPNSGYFCQCKDKYHGTYCEKEYKSKWIAFLLEFFVGWTGAESFYIGEMTAGAFKLILGLLGCCGGICAIAIFAASKGEGGGAAAVCGGIVCLAFASISLWVLINWIMILADAVKDSHGDPLYNGFK